MTLERWRRVEEIFHRAAERAPEDRAACLDDACGGDQELRSEVESLLEQKSSEGLLDRPAVEAAAGDPPLTRTIDQPALLAGRRLSHYEILKKLGEGGMGAVYQARDSRLSRLVAIKTLPADKMGDPGRKRRFVLEAKAASALNHPNIITVHDIDQADGIDFIAMEYVEGKTLRDVMRHHRLPFTQALDYAVQIASALAAAHAAGIIHRDLKPANIMLTESGLVKLLDFGVAKLTQPLEPELTSAGPPMNTEEGALVGTAAYMSPEQAEGKQVDARSDIFSFGSVLYEMLTGKKAFQKGSLTSTLGAIIHQEPEPLGAGVPHDVERVVKRCMHKDRTRRFQHMDDVKIALEELKEESVSGELTGSAVIVQPNRRWLWILTAVAALLLAATLVWRMREAWQSGGIQPVALTALPGVTGLPAFSPDGSKVAFTWNGTKQENYDIYVKGIGSAAPPVPLTNNPSPDGYPAWSPNDKWIAFARRQQGPVLSGIIAIFLIPSIGGPERKIAESRGIGGLCWTPDSKWLVLAGRDSPTVPLTISAISIDTGERRKLTDASWFHDTLHDFVPGDMGPSISPDGRTLAFGRLVTNQVFGMYSLRLSRDLKPEGKPIRVASQDYAAFRGIAWTGNSREIVYSAGDARIPALWRVPASGGRAPKRLPVQPPAISPAIAPKTQRLVYVWWDYSRDFWRLDTRTGERKMLIGSPNHNQIPQYSPDGRKIAFGSNRNWSNEIWTCEADGSNCQQLTFFGGPMVGTPRWSPDGRWLVFDSRAEGQSEIYVIPSDGGAPRRMTVNPATDSVPSWSRDGQWIYFTSDRGGRMQIWKIPAAGGEAVQVTHSGGMGAVESPDGNIYYARAVEGSTMGGQLNPLLRMPVAGGEETEVLHEFRYWMGFALSAKGVYFITPDLSKIQFLELATGKVSTLAAINGSGIDVNDLCVSPDGRYVLWGQLDRNTPNLMLVENFR